MKKIILLIAICLLGIATKAQSFERPDKEKVKIYCEVSCIKYNISKQDVNAIVDFGIAEKASHAKGSIYNSENNKKYSFASPMSVFAYMAKRGWEYVDAIIVSDVWHFILSKEVPVNYTEKDVIGDIDYRN